MSKPKCYQCVYRKDIPGNAHSSCIHPETGLDKSDFPEFEDITAIWGYGKASEAIEKLGIKANMHGVDSGWFYWPSNFDPVWLLNCNGFKAKKKSADGGGA